MKKVAVYTDGACSGNPGPGGWGCLLVYGAYEKEMSGCEPDTTNNRMELMAAIMGLRALNEPCEVDLYSDSSYLVHAFSKGWLANWRKNGWKTTNGGAVLNQDLWRQLLEVSSKHTVHWRYVKGHADNEGNNRCDSLAKSAIEKYRADTERD